MLTRLFSEGTLNREISSQISRGLRHVALLSRFNSQDLQEKRLWYIRCFIQWLNLRGNLERTSVSLSCFCFFFVFREIEETQDRKVFREILVKGY